MAMVHVSRSTIRTYVGKVRLSYVSLCCGKYIAESCLCSGHAYDNCVHVLSIISNVSCVSVYPGSTYVCELSLSLCVMYAPLCTSIHTCCIYASWLTRKDFHSLFKASMLPCFVVD